MRLLFTMAHWHGLAKLRLHTDDTLKLLDLVSTAVGKELRDFEEKVCTSYKTTELPREANARRRRQTGKTSGTTIPQASGSGPRTKSFNMSTYKAHALGDYAETIRTFGTTDSYSTEPVRLVHSGSWA